MKRLLGLLLAGGALGAGVYIMRGGMGRLSGSGRGHGRRRRISLRGEAEADELRLYIDNDGDLYRQQYTPILKNLITKMAKGVYDPAKAEKLWMYLVEAGAKKYNREFGTPDSLPWHKLFSMEDRRQVARELNHTFEVEAKLHNYDHLLPKKYQKRRAV